MILIGMFDSPYVRRVAATLTLQGVAFAHRNWSVGADAAAIRAYSPQGRVPALVLDDGEVLIESSAILDWLDEQAGPARALLPARGLERRRALQLVSLALAAVDKGIQLVYERVFRPHDKRHAPWLERCRGQMQAALAPLEQACAALPAGAWLGGAAPNQADVTLACVATYLAEAAGLELAAWPALQAHVRRCEALPALRAVYAPFFVPQAGAAA